MKKLLQTMALGVALALGAVGTAGAFEFEAFDTARVNAAIASGKPVVVHVFAPWCLQCRAQENILKRLATEDSYDGIAFYRVDHDQQKDVVKALGTPRSTLIAYDDGKEIARMSWGTSEAAVRGVLDAAK